MLATVIAWWAGPLNEFEFMSLNGRIQSGSKESGWEENGTNWFFCTLLRLYFNKENIKFKLNDKNGLLKLMHYCRRSMSTIFLRRVLIYGLTFQKILASKYSIGEKLKYLSFNILCARVLGGKLIRQSMSIPFMTLSLKIYLNIQKQCKKELKKSKIEHCITFDWRIMQHIALRSRINFEIIFLCQHCDLAIYDGFGHTFSRCFCPGKRLDRFLNR